jgi:acetyl-CoA C-acetyltransferase
VSETILGQVLTAGQGQNPARQAHINAGLPEEAAAWASTRSAARACAPWRSAPSTSLGDADIVVAAGRRACRCRPTCANLRAGPEDGRHVKFIDTMIKDGLWDAFNGYHMGTTAENVAQQWQIGREEQDEFAVALAEQGRGRAEGGPVRRRGNRPFTIKTRKGDTVVDTTSTSATAPRSRRWRSCAPPSRRTARSPPGNASGHQRRRGGACC